MFATDDNLPAPGTELRPGLIVRRAIGRGGMGVVLLAQDMNLQRDVAVKLIHPELVSDPRHRVRLLAEARAMARVRHPNVCEIYAFDEYRGTPFFTMEFVDGATLEDWIERKGGTALAIDEVIGFMEPISEALKAIHARGTVHGDLKPSNIIVADGFRVVVVDFGMTMELGADSGVITGVAGTPAYLAPERLAADEVAPRLRGQADIYAAGVMAFQLLSGQLPFTAPDTARILAQHAHKPAPRLSSVSPEMDQAVDDAVDALLVKDPSLRPTQLDDLLTALRGLREAVSRTQARVLVVDDDPDFRALVRECLCSELHALVAEAESAEAAHLMLPEFTPDLVFVDLQLPGSNGLELAAALRMRESPPKVIIATASGSASDWQVLNRLGAAAFLMKPVDLEALVDTTRRVLDRTDDD